jgi:predicted transcriptional regulator
VVAGASRGERPAPGFAGLRRGGAISELLFLFECETEAVYRLRPVADRLGLTVQAVSHMFRQLRARGLVQFREGQYRPTIAGIAWLHALLTSIEEETVRRRERLDIVRSTRAVAEVDLAPGVVVNLELADGILIARPGPGRGSRGRVQNGAKAGALVQVSDLEGIVPIAPAPIRIRTIAESDLSGTELPGRLAQVIDSENGLVAAQGLEAYHAAHAATERPLVRFGVASATREASQVGVSSTVLVLDRDLPRLLAAFGGTHPPPLEVAPLAGLQRRVRRSGRSRARRQRT